MKLAFQKVVVISVISLLLFSCSSTTPISESKAQSESLVLVAGATGRTGQHVVKHLLAAGVNVRVLARSAEKAETLFGDTVEIYVADVKDSDALVDAFKGVSDVISAIGAPEPAGPNSPEFIDYGGVKNLVDASVTAGVDQFVLVSSLGATKLDHRLNKFFGNVLIWKLKGEDSLRASGLDYTIVRPGGLTDGVAREAQLLADQGDRLTEGRISRDDVAEICVAALSEQASRNKTFEVVTEAGAGDRVWADFFAGLSAD